jgi:hypothetical protein
MAKFKDDKKNFQKYVYLSSTKNPTGKAGKATDIQKKAYISNRLDHWKDLDIADRKTRGNQTRKNIIENDPMKIIGLDMNKKKQFGDELSNKSGDEEKGSDLLGTQRSNGYHLKPKGPKSGMILVTPNFQAGVDENTSDRVIDNKILSPRPAREDGPREDPTTPFEKRKTLANSGSLTSNFNTSRTRATLNINYSSIHKSPN